MSSRRTKPQNSAFTLIELSLSVAVIALLIAGIMQVVTQTTRRNATAEAKRKMDVIEAALMDFHLQYGRLPCPADGTQPITSQYFGVEGIPNNNAALASNCTNSANGSIYSQGSDVPSDGGTDKPPDANFWDGQNMVAGDVPVRTLGLSDDYMFDPWGGRFLYAIDNRMTVADAFTVYSVLNNLIGIFTINDAGGNVKAANVITVLMSYGPDGHGAFQLGGVRKNVGNSKAFTLNNCHCTSNAANSTTYSVYTFIQAPATSTSPTDPTNFDDIVRYYTRSSFLSPTDISPTPVAR